MVASDHINLLNHQVIMGGLFKEENETVYFCGYPYEREYNIICDIESSQKFIKNLPFY